MKLEKISLIEHTNNFIKIVFAEKESIWSNYHNTEFHS